MTTEEHIAETKQARRWKTNSLATLLTRLETYQESEIEKAMAKGKEAQAEAVADKVETLKVLIERAAEQNGTVDTLVAMVGEMFTDSDKDTRNLLTLSSVHKAKGKEWQRVFILGKEQFMPSKYARQAWQKQQETNLIYVAVTRALKELVYVTDVPMPGKGDK